MPWPVVLGATEHCTEAPGMWTARKALMADCTNAASPLNVCGIAAPLPMILMVTGSGEGGVVGKLVLSCRLKSCDATVADEEPPIAVFTPAVVINPPTIPLTVAGVVGATPGKEAFTTCEPLSASFTTAVRYRLLALFSVTLGKYSVVWSARSVIVRLKARLSATRFTPCTSTSTSTCPSAQDPLLSAVNWIPSNTTFAPVAPCIGVRTTY